jgi:glycerol-3-phosphate dehydrogenase
MNGGGMHREQALRRLEAQTQPWQILVIGGGATGVSIALDAASRGLSVALLEQSDFGKGTSSRSTKLIHGGVRYLRQGNLTLVRDALRERSLLRNNAPHLVHELPFLIPCRSLRERLFYGIGLQLYDALAVRNSFTSSHAVSAGEAMRLVPALKPNTFRGGVVYHDGQFDDARLLIHLARTAQDHGACLLNYMAVTGFDKDPQGKISTALVIDCESQQPLRVAARCVINAAGPFCDQVRRFDQADCEPMIAASQGVHLVLPRAFFPGDVAMIVPKTSDGRVIFIIPWHDHILVGTTDTPIAEAVLEPTPRREEIAFLLDTAAQYLAKPPTLADVLSVFTGIRPLVKGDKSARTASLSRDHVIHVAASGLITITGGKWTTVRKMAKDCVDRAMLVAGIAPVASRTATLRLHGASGGAASAGPRAWYGTDLEAIIALERESTALAEPLHAELTIRRSEIIWAVRREMARTVEDVLARRTRSLLLHARASLEIAPEVARVMAGILGKDEAWCNEQVDQFRDIAAHYLPPVR